MPECVGHPPPAVPPPAEGIREDVANGLQCLLAALVLDGPGGADRCAVEAAVARLRRTLAALDADAPQPLIAPLTPEVLAVRTGRRGFVIVPQSAIVYVTSLGGVVTVHADTGRFWRDGTLADTERRLDTRRFLRLDHSHLVNVERIAELTPFTHQRYRLLFADAAKSELLLSRDVGRRLRAVLGW